MSCGSFLHRSRIVSLPDPEGVLNTNIMLHVVDWLLSQFVYILYVFRLNTNSCGVVYVSSVKCTNCITNFTSQKRPQPSPFLDNTTSRLPTTILLLLAPGNIFSQIRLGNPSLVKISLY
jgi:hypothetical protein